MPIVESEFALLRDPRIAAQLMDHALGTSPAWLWSTDGSRILWANAVAAAIFGAANAVECTQRRFAAKDHAAAEVLRLARTLPSSGQARLERLRGFGAGFGRALTCTCARVTLSDSQAVVLIVAAEPAGPALTLRERVERLFPDHGQALAAFSSGGALIYATAAAQPRLHGATTLSALGLDALGSQALTTGHAAGAAQAGPVEIDRLGRDAAAVLVVTYAAQTQPGAGSPPPSAPAAPPPDAVPVAAEAPDAGGGELLPEHSLEPLPERRYPLRFVWQMDVDGRFVVGSDEFIELVGPRTTAAFGRLWSEIAAALQLDPDNRVAAMVATRETWSGVVVSWPVDESRERLPVELSGLPVFDRDRQFRGYRGFGVCRDIGRINELIRARRARPLGFMPPAETRPEAAPLPPAARSVETTNLAAEPAQTPEPAAVAAAPSAPAAETAEPSSAEAVSAARAQQPSPGPAPAANVVPFRANMPGEPRPPSLSPLERKAFRELAQELNSRLRGEHEAPGQEGAAVAVEAPPAQTTEPPPPEPPANEPPAAEATAAASEPQLDAVEQQPPPPAHPSFEALLLERLPLGVLIYRDDVLLYANRHLLEWSGHESLDALAAAGGLAALFARPGLGTLAEGGAAAPMSLVTPDEGLPVEARLFAVPWSGGPAHALVLASAEAERDRRAGVAALGAAENEIRELKAMLDAAENETREFKAMLDAAADSAFVLDRDGRIAAASGGAEARFGRAATKLNGRAFGELLVPESERAVRDHFDRLARGALAPQLAQPMHSVPDQAFPIVARVGTGETAPFTLTLTRLAADRFGAILRDAAPSQKAEDELRAAKREVQKATAAKMNFISKVSHEIRTPLNAITGFAEVIMSERFGPIGNERYREYLKDIHVAGTHLVSLLNDVLDLSKVETGQLDLNFADVSLNELTQQCVGIMQPQASRARIIIRTSLTPGLPKVIADERSLRQIVFNLLSNSIRFTGPGGQVIVSTAFADSGEAVLRVRDTGVGMSPQDVEIALAPFRQTAIAASWGSGGTGLGLPLTKALAEANRANFSIKSAPNAGTLIEVAFPPARVVAQ
jgi:signal transduction histidine kinase